MAKIGTGIKVEYWYILRNSQDLNWRSPLGSIFSDNSPLCTSRETCASSSFCWVIKQIVGGLAPFENELHDQTLPNDSRRVDEIFSSDKLVHFSGTFIIPRLRICPHVYFYAMISQWTPFWTMRQLFVTSVQSSSACAYQIIWHKIKGATFRIRLSQPKREALKWHCIVLYIECSIIFFQRSVITRSFWCGFTVNVTLSDFWKELEADFEFKFWSERARISRCNEIFCALIVARDIHCFNCGWARKSVIWLK